MEYIKDAFEVSSGAPADPLAWDRGAKRFRFNLRAATFGPTETLTTSTTQSMSID